MSWTLGFRGRLGTLSPSGPCSLPSIVDAAVRSCWTLKVALVPVVAAIPEPGGGHRKLTRQAKQAAAQDGPGGKNFGSGRSSCGWGAVDLDWGHCRTVEEILPRISSIPPPTCLPVRKRRLGTLRWTRPSPEAEVTEVVRKLLGGKAPGVDEIRPELGTVPLEWQTKVVVVPLFKKGTGECVPTTGGSHFSASLGRSTPGYWRGEFGRIRPIVDPRIQEEQCGFRPGRGTLDQLYTLRRVHRVLEGLWEFAQPVHMCFVDLEKAFDRVPRGILWGVLREYGVRGPLLRAVRSLYDRSRSLVRIAGSKSDLFPVHVGLRQGCPLSPVLFIIFMDRISRRSQGPEGVQFGEPQDFISAFCCR
ncbi:hypothetical protein L3Q82_014756 [Scortum barcoo]|uniref:Uncharacterized protein n=1 Tax=Scortum barcoo TaxID=214431 RepID=A0ACB8VSD0_9TELE|nr:hypothetical protein L3Q82_014756 [Scortum barcoo]